jgi:UDP-glucuronate 4-epimerase
MAYFKFADAIRAGQPIEVYGHGKMSRDFTHISDIVDGIRGVMNAPTEAGTSRVLNIGRGAPVGLMDMIETLSEALGEKPELLMRPMQPGDVTATYADVSAISELCGYNPKVSLKEGLQEFAAWYKDYHSAAS